MADEEQVRRLRESVQEWNKWRKQYPNILLDLRGVDLRGTDLRDADLRGANLSRAALRGANLKSATLRGANLSFADLSEAELVTANLNSATIRRTALNNATLREADLSYATLYDTNLSYAYLRASDLHGVRLHKTDMSFADLSEADLSFATLNVVNLYGANLSFANLSFVRIHETIFSCNDLRTVVGLEQIIHEGPSIVDIKTMLMPQGEVLVQFLRGTGFSNSFIDYLPSLLAANPIQYYSVFISYSHKDNEFALRLYDSLRHHDVPCWYSPLHMKIGDEIRSRIDKSIQTHDRLLLVLSQHSIESNRVKSEVEAAFEKEEKHQYPILFPITLDEAIYHTSLAWAATIRRERHIGDFTHWKDDDEYTKAFDRLLCDLKQESKRGAQ